MRDLLKTDTVDLGTGDPLTIRELSAGARRALQDATKASPGDAILLSAIAVKHGAPEYATESVETIMDSMSFETLSLIAQAIIRLSGLDRDAEAQAEKN